MQPVAALHMAGPIADNHFVVSLQHVFIIVSLTSATLSIRNLNPPIFASLPSPSSSSLTTVAATSPPFFPREALQHGDDATADAAAASNGRANGPGTANRARKGKRLRAPSSPTYACTTGFLGHLLLLTLVSPAMRSILRASADPAQISR